MLMILMIVIVIIIILITIVPEDMSCGLFRMPVWLLLFMNKWFLKFQGFGLSCRKLLRELS